MASIETILQGSQDLPFPAPTRQVAGLVNGVKTDVMVMNFSDKIMVTISQEGRLAHWDKDDSLLPLSGLTATSILGGHAPGQDTVGQLIARQIATAIAMKSPSEKRLLVVGLGLGSTDVDRDSFFAINDLILHCI
ncbi:hypothetical protein N7470_007612 [Penicillium chermesinum]|nr:hypothetical protein N7470_007612 [Penicillium chermesinum]